MSTLSQSERVLLANTFVDPRLRARVATIKDIDNLILLEKHSGSEDLWTGREFIRIFTDNIIKIAIVESKSLLDDVFIAVAYLAFEIKASEIVVWSISIISSFQRMGIGSSLLKWLNKICTEHFNSVPVVAVVRESELKVQLFLKFCGFVCVRMSPHSYDCPPESGLVFTYINNKH